MIGAKSPCQAKRGADHRLTCSISGASHAVSTSLLPSPKGSRQFGSRHTRATHTTPWHALLGHAPLACAYAHQSHSYILLGCTMVRETGLGPLRYMHPLGLIDGNEVREIRSIGP